VVWSTMLLVFWLLEPVIHTLEKFFMPNNPILVIPTILAPQHFHYLVVFLGNIATLS
jgi:hypothetical protein